MKAAFAGMLLTVVGAYGATDPQLVGLMMPDAKVMTGLQVADCQATAFGQFLLKQIPANAGLDNFVAATGFDPRQDLSAIIAASAGDNRWLIAGRGTFQAVRTAGLAEMAGATVTRYKGVDLITGNPNNGGPNRPNRANPNRAGGRPNGAAAASAAPVNAVAFLDSSTVLIGEVQLIKSAVDRHAAGTVFNGPLAVKAQDISAQNQAWAATLTGAADLLSGLNGSPTATGPMANVLQAITGLSLGVQLGGANVTLSGEAATRSNQDAQALVDVVHFLMGMAQANRKDPQGGNVAAMVDATSVSASGASVRLTVTVPEQQLEQLFPTKPGLKKISLPAR
ncbi:MAG TPA: hypothetical protein VN841_25410 [Bryobacteraceae bacterium]|nr:hypothetical protein [Bryobacteraceae bacterium]